MIATISKSMTRAFEWPYILLKIMKTGGKRASKKRGNLFDSHIKKRQMESRYTLTSKDDYEEAS